MCSEACQIRERKFHIAQHNHCLSSLNVYLGPINCSDCGRDSNHAVIKLARNVNSQISVELNCEFSLPFCFYRFPTTWKVKCRLLLRGSFSKTVLGRREADSAVLHTLNTHKPSCLLKWTFWAFFSFGAAYLYIQIWLLNYITIVGVLLYEVRGGARLRLSGDDSCPSDHMRSPPCYDQYHTIVWSWE